MAIGIVTIGETPCCGVIERTWEAVPDSQCVPTGMLHTPGELGILVYGETPPYPAETIESGPYAPTFTHETRQIEQGICPDCGKRFR